MLSGSASAVDRFGFALPSLSKEETCARRTSAGAEALGARNWTTPDASAYSPKRLKQLVRAGVPPGFRADVWLQLSGGIRLRQQYPANYFASLATRPAPKAAALDVEAAISRQLPGHHTLVHSHSVQAVLAIVLAYHQHTSRPRVQNVSCFAAFLVSVYGLGKEEDCFWTLVGLLDEKLPAAWDAKVVSRGPSVEQRTLEAQLRRRCPRIVAALASMDVCLHGLTAPWLAQLYCGVLPAETTVRVWDCLLSEGPKVLFRVGIALLKREESVVTGNLQKARNIQWRVSRTYNADALLKVAFKGLGSFPSAELDACRREIAESLLAGRTSQAKRLEALLCPPRLSPRPSSSSTASELSTITEVHESSASEKPCGAEDLALIQTRLPPLKI